MEKKQIILNSSVYLLGFIVFFNLVSCKNKENAIVNIKLDGYEKRTAVFTEQRVVGAKILDTLSFSFRAKLRYNIAVRQPTFYTLKIENGPDIFFMINANDRINVKGKEGLKVSEYDIEGSPQTKQLNVLYDSLFATRVKLKPIRDKFNNSSDETQKDSLAFIYKKAFEKHHKFSIKFVLDNLTSLVSMAALYQEITPNAFVFSSSKDIQYFKLVSDSLIKYYPRHRHVMALKRNFDQMKGEYNLHKLLSQKEEVIIELPDLNLPNIESKKISLLSQNTDIVLLNFWNTANIPSMEQIPVLNNTFKKYSGKGFLIYNVYLGKSINDWKKTVKFEEIDKWINVADTAFPRSKTMALYNVTSLPLNYLIDIQEKKILQKDINPHRLDKTLLELLN